MSKLFIGRLIIAAIGSVIGALTFVVSPTFASNLGLAATTPGAGTATTTPFLPTDLFIYALLILLSFGLLLIAGIMIYVYRIQLKYYTITQSLSQMGVGVRATPISSFATLSSGATFTPEEAPKKLKIDGPGFVAVGSQAVFTATKESDGTLADKAHWSVTPDGTLSLSEKGATVTVNALKTGPFVLSAKIDTETPKSEGSVSVAAVDPKATTEDIPFMGQGYGSLVIAVLIVVSVILLALTGILSGEVVATLFGGLLGYIFGVTTSTGTTASKKSDAKSASGS